MLFIFDMVCVVTTTSHAEIEIAKLLGLSKEEFVSMTQNDFSRLTKGEISTKDFWNNFEKATGIKIESDLWNYFFHPQMDPAVKQLVLKLRKNHRVICGTNTIENHYQNHLTRNDYAIVDETYTADHMGREKPDPKFWEYILMSEGYAACDAFFTDDKLLNVEGAKKAGIKAVQFLNAKLLKKEIKLFFQEKR